MIREEAGGGIGRTFVTMRSVFFIGFDFLVDEPEGVLGAYINGDGDIWSRRACLQHDRECIRGWEE